MKFFCKLQILTIDNSIANKIFQNKNCFEYYEPEINSFINKKKYSLDFEFGF